MNPMAPLRNKFKVLATTPCRGLYLVRLVARCFAVLFCGAVLSAFAKDNIPDLSSRPPFNAYVGRNVHLLRSLTRFCLVAPRR
jgi:hypothetical protein